jgi:hypothetical protein
MIRIFVLDSPNARRGLLLPQVVAVGWMFVLFRSFDVMNGRNRGEAQSELGYVTEWRQSHAFGAPFCYNVISVVVG